MAYHNTANSFDGCIHEFPGICVDKFNSGGSIHLLTHCHADHLLGLDAKSFGQKVYCSKITKELLMLNDKYHTAASFLYPIEFNQPFVVYVGGSYVKITLIPAYHCAGSTMFLLEGSTESVLITGDIRAEAWWVDSLKKNPYLFPYTCTKTLSNIYFDSTFGYRGEPYIEIPPNNDGIETAIELIKLYPVNDPEIEFNFRDKTLGFEEAWSCIVNAVQGNISVDNDLQSRFRILKNDTSSCIPYGLSLNKILETKAGPTFHVLKSNEKKITISIKQCIKFNIMDLSGVFLPVSLEMLSSEVKSEIEVVNETKAGNKVCIFKSRKWILPKDGKDLLPFEIKLIFSRHSSYSETCHLISTFKPLQVFPCSESKSMWRSGFSMNRLFGQYCRGNQFKYDSLMFKIYGNSNISGPVTTVNRWDPLQLDQEYNRLVDLHDSNNYQFIGQYHLSKLNNTSKEKCEFETAWKKDMRIQNIIAGRGEEKYKKIIQNYQKLYYQAIQRDVQVNMGDLANYVDDSSSQSSYSTTNSRSFSFKSKIIVDIPNIVNQKFNTEDKFDKNDNYDDLKNVSTASCNFLVDTSSSQVKRQINSPESPKRSRPTLTRKNQPCCQFGKQESNHLSSLSANFKSNTQPVASKPDKVTQVRRVAFSINEYKVKDICSQLKEDPSSWFSFKINSLAK